VIWGAAIWSPGRCTHAKVIRARALLVALAFSQFVRRGVTSVPDIVGQSRSAAEAVLVDSGLALAKGELAERHHDEIAAGLIVEQRPGASGLVKRGSSVKVIYSLGPEVAEVPDLVGRQLTEAQVELSAVGLTLGRTVSVYQLTGDPGLVAEQDPPAGSVVGFSRPIDVYVGDESHAEVYVMPDLVYRDVEVVRAYFERRGFQMGGVKPEAYEGLPPGVILRQYPLAGHPVTRSDVISLVVSISADEMSPETR
jgi:beta-lactam-binding protein with PASTA domain